MAESAAKPQELQNRTQNLLAGQEHVFISELGGQRQKSICECEASLITSSVPSPELEGETLPPTKPKLKPLLEPKWVILK